MKEPKLRFKEGNGMQFPDWEEKKIGELGTFTKGAPLSKADISDCGVPLILYGELYTTYNEVAYDIKRRTQSEVDKKYYSLVGDVVIPTSGETAEEISTATCVMAQNVILAGDLNIYRSDIVDGRIMSYILNHQAKWKIATLAQGKSVVHIQATQISGVAVKYPPSIVEQQKIASLFTELDALIQSAEKELEGYRELKQGMLQKMFPKKGEKVPKIRFPEFTGNWEQRKLNEVVAYTSSSLAAKDAKDDGLYDLYDANEIIGKTDVKCISQPYISIIKDGSGVGRVRILPSNTMIIGTMGAITSKSSDLHFIYALLTKADLGMLISGSSIPHIYFKDYGNECYLIPNLQEQKKIGEYFSNLDNLIALQQKEIDGYKELKKGLLQQMFC